MENPNYKKLLFHPLITSSNQKENEIINRKKNYKLFIEINNSKDLNQFINLINESLEKNDPIENVKKGFWKCCFIKRYSRKYLLYQ